MIGIYKITNITNGKSYVGQSNDIERRFKEHQQKGTTSRIPVDIAIQKYGKDNFLYEVLEECSLAELNERETYWICKLNSVKKGYNCSTGGEQQSIGVNNGRAKLTEEDIITIRTAYAQHRKQKDVYKLFKNKVSFKYFQNIWQGQSWRHIMPEVFTPENIKYYTAQSCQGEKSSKALLSDNEVIAIRQRYVSESAQQIYQDYKTKMSYQTLQQILWGRSYSYLPIYKKKTKQWINI